MWRDECEKRVSNQCYVPRIFFTPSTPCGFLSQNQCIAVNTFWWIYWPWNFLLVLQTHAVLAPWRCCTKEIYTLTTTSQRITSFNSSWTCHLAKFICCPWFLSWKKEGRTDLPRLIRPCGVLPSLLESPRTKAARAIPLRPLQGYAGLWVDIPPVWTASLGLGMVSGTSSKTVSCLVRS